MMQFGSAGTPDRVTRHPRPLRRHEPAQRRATKWCG